MHLFLYDFHRLVTSSTASRNWYTKVPKFSYWLCFPRLVSLKQLPVLDLGVPRTTQPFMQLQNLSGERLNFLEMQPHYSLGFIWHFSCEISGYSKNTCPFLIDMGSVGTISQVCKGHTCDFVRWLHKKHHQQDLLLKVLLWVFLPRHTNGCSFFQD